MGPLQYRKKNPKQNHINNLFKIAQSAPEDSENSTGQQQNYFNN